LFHAITDEDKLMRLFMALMFLGGMVAAAHAQDRRDWQSLGQLQAGDKIRMTMKTGPVDGSFVSWTAQQVSAGNVTARRDDVVKIERYRAGGMGRGKHAVIGAVIGFGAGAGIGAAVGGCRQDQLCFVGRGTVAAAFGGVGLLVGAGVGALMPAHHKDLIYLSK
jgi:hypothetical protein